jgi:dipeptidase
MRAGRGKMDVAAAMDILRDHRGVDYRPDSHFLGNRICAHAGNKLARHAMQTTGSLIAHLHRDVRTFWATGTAAPCVSIFKPIRFEGEVLPDIGPPPGAQFDPLSLWWHHEQLHRQVLRDYRRRIKIIADERRQLENTFIRTADEMPPGARSDFMADVFSTARQKTDDWIQKVQALPVAERSGWNYRRYWKSQNAAAGLLVGEH